MSCSTTWKTIIIDVYAVKFSAYFLITQGGQIVCSLFPSVPLSDESFENLHEARS